MPLKFPNDRYNHETVSYKLYGYHKPVKKQSSVLIDDVGKTVYDEEQLRRINSALAQQEHNLRIKNRHHFVYKTLMYPFTWGSTE
jgi:hypothetical protein